MTSYEIHCLTKDCGKCPQQGQNIIDMSSKALDMCLSMKELCILELITDLSLPNIWEDGLPLSNLKNLDQVKKSYEKWKVEVIILNILDESVFKYLLQFWQRSV